MKRITVIPPDYQEPIYSMAQIGQNESPGFCIWVNPDQGRNDDPYFKMYNAQKYASAEKSIRNTR